MNWEQLARKWKQFSGKAKARWGNLSENDWAVIEGKRDRLIGLIQERYGIAKEEAELQVADFERSFEAAPRERRAS
jgi:uncharacterized protein YjbJ (UPF0337 family)